MLGGLHPLSVVRPAAGGYCFSCSLFAGVHLGDVWLMLMLIKRHPFFKIITDDFIKQQKATPMPFFSASVSVLKKKKILPEEYIAQILVYSCIFHLHLSTKYRNIRMC